ncbi:MAG: Txe/YoeB family addiction module toxin [Flavobacteriales bacterium]
MKLIFVDESWEDYLHWQKFDRKKLKKINELIRDIIRSPYDGAGKPEQLKYQYAGYWSRRIDGEHRLIYKIKENNLIILKCRFHYDEN